MRVKVLVKLNTSKVYLKCVFVFIFHISPVWNQGSWCGNSADGGRRIIIRKLAVKWNLLTIAQFSVGTHNMDLFRCPLSLCFSLMIETNILLLSGNSRDPSFFVGWLLNKRRGMWVMKQQLLAVNSLGCSLVSTAHMLLNKHKVAHTICHCPYNLNGCLHNWGYTIQQNVCSWIKTIPGYKLSVQLLVPLSVCHKTKTKKNFLFFHGQSKRISEVPFVLLFRLKFVAFSCCFPKSPQFIFLYIVIAFPISANLCKWKCWLIRC